jgi:hypothetical protein
MFEGDSAAFTARFAPTSHLIRSPFIAFVVAL